MNQDSTKSNQKMDTASTFILKYSFQTGKPHEDLISLDFYDFCCPKSNGFNQQIIPTQ